MSIGTAWVHAIRESFRRGPAEPARGRLFYRRGKTHRGQASLEMLIVLIFLIPLLFGAIEISRGVAIRAALDSGIGIAVRAMSLDPSVTQWDWVRIRAQEAVNQNVFGTDGVGAVGFKLYASDGVTEISQADLNNQSYGYMFCLEGTVTFTPSVPLLPLNTISIRVRHYGMVERMLTP